MTKEYTPAALRFAQAAYMAQECIKCVHDLTSLETAGQAFLYFTRCMVEIAVEDQELARRWRMMCRSSPIWPRRSVQLPQP